MKKQGWLVVAWALLAAACGGSGGGPTGPVLGGDGDGSATSQQRLGLTGRWQLVTLAEAGKPAVSIAEPERFTADFAADGRLSLRADCNSCGGGYSAQAASLEVGLMACTLAACPSAPVDTTFAGLVGGATAWTATADRLELRSTAGTLSFRR